MFGRVRDHALVRPPVEQRILQLQRGDWNTILHQSQQVFGVEIGEADLVDLAGAAQLVEPMGGVEPARRGIVPPMELHEVKPFHVEPPQRLVDDALDVTLGD